MAGKRKLINLEARQLTKIYCHELYRQPKTLYQMQALY